MKRYVDATLKCPFCKNIFTVEGVSVKQTKHICEVCGNEFFKSLRQQKSNFNNNNNNNFNKKEE